jgi:hypothetical protein
MVRIFYFFTFLSISFSCFSQDTNLVHKQFFRTQKYAMATLGAWSAGNLIISPIVSNKVFQYRSPRSTEAYFHQMNFNWNLVNGVIAGLGYWSNCKRKKNSWDFSSLEKDKKKLTTNLAINMGLDVAYLVSGILLNRVGHNSSSYKDLKIGYGNSLILQGGFLLVFDGVFILKLIKNN